VKVIVTIVVTAAFVATWVLGYVLGARAAVNDRLAQLGMTRSGAVLYRRATKILNRLAQITDLDGQMAGDSLSPETQKQVTEWLADYRKEINKV
jgi:FlaG/FlaF family flagellin (archaellin)